MGQQHVPTSDRRMKRLLVGEHQLLALLVGLGDRMPLAVRVARWPDLPTGCRLVGVHHDIYSRTFFFVLEHPSFEVVPDGELIPPLDCEVTAVELDDVRAFSPTYSRSEEFGPDGPHRIVYEEETSVRVVNGQRYLSDSDGRLMRPLPIGEKPLPGETVIPLAYGNWVCAPEPTEQKD